MKKKILLMSLFTTLLYSAPSSTFKQLKETPVSLLDMGIFKTQQFFTNYELKTKLRGKHKKTALKVFYDEDKNIFSVAINYYMEYISQAKAKNACQEIVKEIQETGNVNIPKFLSGYTSQTATDKEKFNKSITERIQYKTNIFLYKKELIQIECSTSLNSDKITIKSNVVK